MENVYQEFARVFNREMGHFGFGITITGNFISRILKRCNMDIVRVQK